MILINGNNSMMLQRVLSAAERAAAPGGNKANEKLSLNLNFEIGFLFS